MRRAPITLDRSRSVRFSPLSQKSKAARFALPAQVGACAGLCVFSLQCRSPYSVQRSEQG